MSRTEPVIYESDSWIVYEVKMPNKFDYDEGCIIVEHKTMGNKFRFPSASLGWADIFTKSYLPFLCSYDDEEKWKLDPYNTHNAKPMLLDGDE